MEQQRGDKMTPKRPIEVVNASKACANAWIARDEIIDTAPELVREMDKVCEWLGEMYTDEYFQWQRMGGTSDIESLALAGVGQLHNTADVVANRFGSVRMANSINPYKDLEIWQQEVEETRKSDFPR
jgi:hypothetical protein